MTTASGGTYTLVFELQESRSITVGALGTRTFDAGWYAYVGSAMGPGGFARVDRHRALARGDRDTRHWHIDYLLGDCAVTLVTVETLTGVDAECAIATAIDRHVHDGFGCSDCSCQSHLHYAHERAPLDAAIEEAFLENA